MRRSFMDPESDSDRTPLPYNGWDLTRREHRGTPHVRIHRHGDVEVEYSFNSLGFRCGEYNPSSQYRIFAFGCSQTYGIGIGDGKNWAARFVDIFCERHGISHEDVCFMNFAEPGASADYVVRSLLTQCSRAKPDLVLMNLPSAGRAELLVSGYVFDLGEWLDSPDYIDQFRQRITSPELKSTFEDALARARSHEEFASQDQRSMNLLKNLLLAQNYCHARQIEALVTIDSLTYVLACQTKNSEVFDPLVAGVDKNVVCDFSIDEFPGRRSLPGDPWHFDEESHRRFAEAMFSYYETHGGAAGIKSCQGVHGAETEPHGEAAVPSAFKRLLFPGKNRARDDANTYPLF